MEQAFGPVPEERAKKSLDKGTIATIVCTVVLVALMVGLIISMLRVRIDNKDPYSVIYEAAGIIEDQFFFLEDEPEALAKNAIRGMLSGIEDPYAAYYTEEEYQAMLESDAGDYQGIGISILTPDEVGSIIFAVYPDSPMAEAGAQAGDIILSVNGTRVAGMAMDDYLALFSEEDGGSDTIELMRGNTQFTVTVTRRAVHATRINSELLEGGIGYIRIEQFTGSVVSEFIAALTDLQAQGITGLVVDVRDNPGGGLTEVLGVTSYLLPKGELICTIKSRHGTEAVYRAEGKERVEGLPIVVLVNGNSASASELFSGALQDHGLAKVIGTQTYGKGIVQSYFRLKDGAGWVKITTDAYYTPNDVCIHETGITPDYVIELSKDWEGKPPSMVPHEEDAQLLAALDILMGALQAVA